MTDNLKSKDASASKLSSTGSGFNGAIRFYWQQQASLPERGGRGQKQESTAQTALESGRLFWYLKSHASSILEHFSPFGNNRQRVVKRSKVRPTHM